MCLSGGTPWPPIVLLLTAVGFGAANFNLYLRPNEVHRLLGLSAELYYVREGTINHYALEFVMPIPAPIVDLHFTWQNLKPQQPIDYNFALAVSDIQALGLPEMNIQKKGVIPVKEDDFLVTLPCTGKVDAEVELQIHLNITTPHNNNITSLTLRRNKICLKDGERNVTSMVDASAMVATNSSIYIGVGLASGLIVFLIVGSVTCYLHLQRQRRIDAIKSSTAVLTSQNQAFLRVDTPNNASSTASNSSFRRLTPIGVSVRVNDLRASELSQQISEITLDRRKLSLQEKVQEGTFGQIYRGLLTEDQNESDSKKEVMIKTVCEQASSDQVSILLKEGMLMFALDHSHLLPVVGVCMDEPERPLLVYPYSNQGNLKRFLQKCKFSAEGQYHTLLTQDLVAMAIQIVRGMIYLNERKVVHRDLAARNCVVADGLQVRVTDNALSRDLFPNEYDCLGDNENRPVKWLAIESLLRKDFSAASDVWAFGVTLWELMSLGQLPYVEVDPFEMGANLIDGYRLTQPINCPDKLYTMMAYCWTACPEDRPTFTYLLTFFEDFYTALGSFI